MPKFWMGGVGTLCAIAHYRAALLDYSLYYPKKAGGSSTISVIISGGNLAIVLWPRFHPEYTLNKRGLGCNAATPIYRGKECKSVI